MKNQYQITLTTNDQNLWVAEILREDGVPIRPGHANEPADTVGEVLRDCEAAIELDIEGREDF